MPRTIPFALGFAVKGGQHAASLAAIVVVLSAIVVVLLGLSARGADQASVNRQDALVALVLQNSVAAVAHDQESVTVWDDTVRQVRASKSDLDWLDNNVGVWLHTYYGLDEAYVLDSAGRPLYAMRDGARVPPVSFEALRGRVEPLAAKLRSKQRARMETSLPSNQLSLGAADVIAARDRPAIISVKPIVSDSGEIEQAPGSEHLHVAVRYLDGTFVHNLARAYMFRGARISLSPQAQPGEVRQAWRSTAGRVAAYFFWKPFAPGAAIFRGIAPIMVACLILVTAVLILMVRRIASRTRQLEESRAYAQHLAFHDVLTGLPNRALFEDRLDHALEIFRSDRERKIALLYLDLDRFKNVNDTLGHQAGDDLLRQFAQRIRASIRPSDTAARLGGDEFAIIQEVHAPEETVQLCKQLLEITSRPFRLADQDAFVGISIGVAVAGEDAVERVELSRKADIALYSSKDKGRGCFTMFAEDMDEPIRARETIERDLRVALAEGDQLKVWYQPQYSSQSGEITGVEALVRWDHPTGGLMSPALFIPVAEETGQIRALGEWVLREVCCTAADWRVPVSVNVSPVELRSPHYATRVLGILAEYGFNPACLELEITETALMTNSADCVPNLKMLRAFGIRIALDDFGTGYSSLSHLNQFEVDRVKIDRSFVDRIDHQDGGGAVVQAIVDLAQAKGLRITAEGVETAAQCEFLRQIGCDELQGFLLARPMTAPQAGMLFQQGAEQHQNDRRALESRREQRRA